MTNLPVEMLHERIYLQGVKTPEAHWFYLADEDEIDLSKATEIRDAYDPDDETHTPTHIVFRYTCSDGWNRILCLPQEQESEITAEDFTEWCASSCGMTYNAYIGKPWLD